MIFIDRIVSQDMIYINLLSKKSIIIQNNAIVTCLTEA